MFRQPRVQVGRVVRLGEAGAVGDLRSSSCYIYSDET